LRERLSQLAQVQETAPACPPDWGALRVRPHAVELWSEATDRIHERRLFAREGDAWALTLLAP
jgi:pyridoxamine 5'-phosphate oxidase